MVVQAVLEGQIASDHATIDELMTAHHLLADQTIEDEMNQQLFRKDVIVFGLDWEYLLPN